MRPRHTTAIFRRTREPGGVHFRGRGLISYRVAAALAATCGTAAGGTPHLPNLPTPCLVGPCGTNPGILPFVQSGQVGAVAQGTNLTVNQSSNQAILNWQDFNIAPGYSVTFKQPGVTSSALNQIWSASPSVIAGELTANGQVYLINQNGIVFDKGAQVDVGGLVASSLGVSDTTFLNGILSQNLAASYPTTQPAVFQSTNAAPGAVTVTAGASLQVADGGRIMLLAPVVSNAGTISTPDGQAILGGGTQVYLAASSDPTLRGLLIAVNGQGLASNSTVTNTGSVSADRGNVTLAGLAVNQSGIISATTSVSANGSIFLVAGDTSSATDQNFYYDRTGVLGYGSVFPNNGGTLTLGPGSVTQVLPDSADTSTITNQQTFFPSEVMLAGHAVIMQGGADIHAPSGTVGVLAAADPFGAESGEVPSVTSDGSRIYLAAGSTIDVAGLTAVPIPATRNILDVTLESIDLQNDPLLRNGILHGATVYVNANIGSDLFNITPYVDNIGHGIDEELTPGGSITLDSFGDLITRAGSMLNVSGGSIAYQSGYGPATTKLVGSNGLVYDISNAPNDINYSGFAGTYSYTDPTWGTTTSSSAEAYYPGYTQGANAGGIQILAPQMYLRGSMEGQTVTGILQRLPGTVPQGGALAIGNTTQVPGRGNPVDLRSPNVTFTATASDTLGSAFDPLSSELPATDATTLVLATTGLAPGGFNTLDVSSNGTIIFPAFLSLNLPGGGAVHLVGESIEMEGAITAPGSTVSLNANAFIRSPFAVTNYDVTLGEGASINVAGEWVNDSARVTPLPGTAPVLINGGSVSLKAADDVITGADSIIDVSGGAWLNVNNQLTAGAAGSVALAADSGPVGSSPVTGVVQLGGVLEGASLEPGDGGSLALQSGSITVGNRAAGTPGELLLPSGFFSQSGFGSYTLDGVNGVTIGAPAQPVTINLVEKNLVLDDSYVLEPTAAALQSFTTLETLPTWERSPASAAFIGGAYVGANNQEIGGLVLNQGTTIEADPGATVSLTASEANLTMLGSIIAPAGNITLQLGPTNPGAFPYLPTQQLLLGPQAAISAPAAPILNANDPLGLVQGTVLPGGTISLQANLGYVVTDPGSVLNVAGAAATLDILTGSGYRSTPVAGNGGTIDIDAREGLVLQGALNGHPAAVAGAGGGTLSIGLDLFNFDATVGNNETDDFNQPTTARVVTITNIPAGELSSSLVSGTALLSADTLTNEGFQSITIKATDVIAFNGAVSLTAPGSLTLDAPVLLGGPGASVELSAPHVMLGDYYTAPGASQETLGTATGGDANLAVSAAVIDLRGSSDWDGLASATLNSGGDIRLAPAETATAPVVQTGELFFAGNLSLRAAQVYPTTGTQFTIDDQGAVTVLGQGGAPQVPLSAAGELTIDATNISQQGVLRAPLGQISLNAVNSVVLTPGSTTSVSADGEIIPYGSTLNGLEWTYDNGTGPAQVSMLPTKMISISGPSVQIVKGAMVDLSGGGDVYAYEFIAGPGGSKDVLDSSAGGYQYAILPGLGSPFAPIDVQYGGGAAGSAPDVYLSGVPGISAGVYPLLPARYALLPGAYAVNVVATNSDVLPGVATEQPDGAWLAAGRLGVAGTAIVASRTSTLLIVPDGVVRTQSQYTDSYGDTFFTAAGSGTNTAATAPIPADGGTLQLVSSGSMTLGGTFNFSPASFTGPDAGGKQVTELGIGGDAEIVAPQITVVDALGTSNNAGLQLPAAALNNLHPETLILGATSTLTAEGDTLVVDAQSVSIANTADQALTAPNIILAATGQVTLVPGSALSASGGAGQVPGAFLVSGDGALLVASAGPQAAVLRTEIPAQPQAQLIVGSGATVSAAGSVLLDATENTSIAPEAALSTPALSVDASAISLGNAPAGTLGFLLTPALLSQLAGVTDLTLVSGSTINLYGTVQLGVPGAAGRLYLQSLTLDSGGIAGYGSGNKAIEAGIIDLQDSGGTGTFTSTPNGTGALTVEATSMTPSAAGSVNLGEGNLSIQGFGDVTLQSAAAIDTTGNGALNLVNAGNLTLVSPRLISAAGETYEIVNASGGVTLQSPAGSSGPTLPRAGPGGAITIAGTTIAQNGDIDFPAGMVTLHASGALTLGPSSITSTAGVVVSLGNTYAVAPGGTIEFVSDDAGVSVAGGAIVDVSGAAAPGAVAAAAAGSLIISAPGGELSLAGTLKGNAPAGQLAGNFVLDVGSLESFSSLNSALEAGGFTGIVSERVRSGNVTVAASDVVTASQFTLAADSGSIEIAGEINTSGGNALSPDGGAIAIWAGGNLDVMSGSQLNASAGSASNGAAARGGSITLGSASGTLDLQPGSGIATLGSQSDADGYVTLVAPAINNHTDVAITGVGSSLQTSQPLVVEGVTVYQMSGSATLSNAPDTLSSAGIYSNLAIGSSTFGTSGILFSDAATLAGNSAAIAARLEGTGAGLPGQTLEIRPGIEVEGASDITLTSTWDLENWSAALGVPVNVTLRASGNLLLEGSISDGFTNTNLSSTPSSWTFGTQVGDSAALRLSAGSDLTAANPLASALANSPEVAAGDGNFILTPGNLVRTGQGSIQIAAANNVQMGFDPSNGTYADTNADSAVIYTAGVPSQLSAAQSALFPVPVFSPRGPRSTPFVASYPTDGGDISITAGQDVVSAPSAQLITDWLWRRGAVNSDGTIAAGENLTWWVVFSDFQQGVGALGGGDVNVSAGGDIVNLSAVVPTTGRLLGLASTLPSMNDLIVDGGGSLTVRAGGDIASGVFETDLGNALLSSGGAFTSGRVQGDTNPNGPVPETPIYPILVLGDSDITTVARTGVTLDAAVNTTSLPEVEGNIGFARAYFNTFAPTSSLDVISIAGDVVLNNDTQQEATVSVLGNLAPHGTYDQGYDYSNLAVYPPVVTLSALSGSIFTINTTTLYPSAVGNIELLAENNVTIGGVVEMSEVSPSLAANPLHPVPNLETALSGGGDLSTVPLPVIPLHQSDTQPVEIVAATGDIGTDQGEGLIVLPKAAVLIAGGDIEDLTYTGKNLNPGDVTLFEAGGAINFETALAGQGEALQSSSEGIQVAGPGVVEVLAGAGINLSDSNGIVTTGALNDPRLPESGASLIVGAGFGASPAGGLRSPADANFINAYLAPATDGAPGAYAALLESYVAGLDPATNSNLTYGESLALFRALPMQAQLPLLSQVLYDELSATGIAHTVQGASYQRGFAAINTLFPATGPQGQTLNYSGDIDMFFSQLKTEQGGDVDTLVPGGSVIVGLPNPPADLTAIKSIGIPPVPAAANLGVLVLGTGAIQGFVENNFTVNQSRMLTLEGGNIILWASDGNIDAGRGAKSASGAPPPIIETDAEGNVFVDPINDVSGSGIGQLVVTPGVKPGFVNLIAPSGVVNAGDAGIRVAGNLNIAAVQVIGANNITVGGTATGVPVSEAGAFAGALSGASALGDVSKNAVDQITNNLSAASNLQQLSESLIPTFIVVKMFCLGAECEAH